jgi:4-cresol dehydrogenase (hydroxylating)
VPPDPDPDRDRCGVLWLAPVAPMTGNEAAKLVEWAERTLLAHGFEPLVSITLLTERSLACIISITYDRDEPGEDAKAMACYRDLHRQFDNAGYYSYRLGIAGMELYRPDAAYADLLRAIKQAVDPNRILAPGRYLPAAERLP